MAKTSNSLIPRENSDPNARSTVTGGPQQGIDAFDGVWNRVSEGIYPLYNLSVVVAYLQLGLADVEFPRTSRSGPSDLVLVVKTPQTRAIGDTSVISLLPYPVNWRIWQNVVVPVLNDSSFKLNNGFSRLLNGLNQPAVILQDFRRYVDRLRAALRRLSQSQGLIPPPNKGENTLDYNGIYTTNNIPERKCCCPQSNPDCCEE